MAVQGKQQRGDVVSRKTVGLHDLPVEIIYAIHIYALSSHLQHVSRRLRAIMRDAPASVHAWYILSAFDIEVERRENDEWDLIYASKTCDDSGLHVVTNPSTGVEAEEELVGLRPWEELVDPLPWEELVDPLPWGLDPAGTLEFDASAPFLWDSFHLSNSDLPLSLLQPISTIGTYDSLTTDATLPGDAPLPVDAAFPVGAPSLVDPASLAPLLKLEEPALEEPVLEEPVLAPETTQSPTAPPAWKHATTCKILNFATSMSCCNQKVLEAVVRITELRKRDPPLRSTDPYIFLECTGRFEDAPYFRTLVLPNRLFKSLSTASQQLEVLAYVQYIYALASELDLEVDTDANESYAHLRGQRT